MKFLSLLLVGALAMLGFFLVTAGGFAGAEILYVDDDAAPGGNGTLETPFQTIQDAVDNATGGDTVRVFNGTYLENVLVNVTVSLIGNGSANTTIDGSSAGNVVLISASFTNISGFSVTNGENGIKIESDNNQIFENNCSTNDDYGLYLRRSDWNIVENNTCTSNGRDGMYLDFSHNNSLSRNSCNWNSFNGIRIMASVDNRFTENHCDHNTVTGIEITDSESLIIENNICLYNQRGINVQTSSGNEISQNNCNNNSFGINLMNSDDNIIANNSCWNNTNNGIGLEGSDDSTLFNNTCSENDSDGISLDSSSKNNIKSNKCFSNELQGIDIQMDSDENNITQNSCFGNSLGIFIDDSEKNYISNNTCFSNTDQGIGISGINNTIDNNTCYGNSEGILLHEADDNKIINNNCTGNVIGILVRERSENSSAHNNLIENNTDYGIDASDNFGFTFNATDNWWGNNSGPYHPTLNPTGTGNNVTDDVIFDPWTGKQVVEQDMSILYVATSGNDTTGDGSEQNPYLTIQKAIDFATNETETIRVFEGTFEETIIVNKTLAIIGNGSALTIIDGAVALVPVVNITVESVSLSELAVTNGGDAGVRITADDTILTNLSITDHATDGINATDIVGLTIIGCMIQSNSGDGIYIDPSDTISITGTTVTGNENGLNLSRTTDVTVTDSDLTGNNNDIVLTGSSGAELYNSTYATPSVESGSSFQVWWTFQLVVKDENGTALEGARVYLNDTNTNPVIDAMTDANGTIPVRDVLEGIEMNSGMQSLNPHDLTIMKDGLRTKEESLTIDSHQSLQYTLDPPAPGPEAIVTIDTITFMNETDFVDFDATPSTGDGLTFFWLFEDGTNSTEMDPVADRQYNKAGVHIVTLNVTDDQNRSSLLEIRIVVSNVAPTGADIAGGDKNGNEDQVFPFAGSAIDTDILGYSWDFGDGTFGVGQTPTHSYSNEGIYTVNLTITDDDGAAVYFEIIVTVTNRAPNADGRALNAPQPPGMDIYFTAEDSDDPDPSDVPDLIYFWEFGDGQNANGMFVSHAYVGPGTYTVNLTVTDDNTASDMDSFTVTVNNQDPVAVPGEDISVAKGENFTLNGDGSSDPDANDLIDSWSWDMASETTLFGEEITYRFNDTGEKTVTLTVTDQNGGSHQATLTVTVLNDLPFNLSIVASNESIIQGETINFTGSANDADPITYSWDFGDNSTGATGNMTNHTFVKTGIITVTLFVSDGMDEVNITMEIEVANISPEANFTASKDTVVQDEEITFDGSDSVDLGGDELTYHWDFGDDTTGTGVSPKHSYTTAGTYTVELVVNDGTEESQAVSMEITVEDAPNAPPTAVITLEVTTAKAGEVMVFDARASTDPTDDDLTYTWDFGDNTSKVAGIVVTHAFGVAGSYNVTLTVSDGVGEDEITSLVTITKGDAPVTTGGEDDGGGLGMIGILAIVFALVLLILFMVLFMFVTDKDPKEFSKVVALLKEGKTVKDMAPAGGGMMAVEAIAVEGEVLEAVVSGDALEAALVAEVEGVEVAEEVGGRRRRRKVELIDEKVNEFDAKKNSYLFSMHKLERDRDRLKKDLDSEPNESRKKETERQLTNIETKIEKQSDRIKKLEVEAEEEQIRMEAAAKAGAGGVMVAGIVGEGGEFDPAAVEASIPKPESLVALETAKDGIDRLKPAKDNELERKQAELEAYADYADDPDYYDYVADLQTKVDAMETFVKRREKTGKGSGFPSTTEMAGWHDKVETIKKKGKKGASKKEIAEKGDLEPRITKFEGMIGQSMNELLDELFAEAAEEIDVQIAEEEAAWEEAKAEAVAKAEEEFNARKAAAEAAEAGAGGTEAEAVEAEAVEAEAVEAEAVEAEEVEAEAVEAEAVEAEEVEAEAVEAEEVEAEEAEAVDDIMEAEAVEVEGVEVEGVEIDGVEIEGVEVEGVEVEGVEIDDAPAGRRRKTGAGAAAGAAAKSAVAGNQVTCPGCNTKLAVGTDKRPFAFNCPKCSRKITLEAKPGDRPSGAGAGASAGAGAPSAGSEVTCPRCRSKLNVGTTQRPFTFNCPKCTQRITLQAPGQGGAGRPPPGPGPQGRYGGMPPGYPSGSQSHPPQPRPGAGLGYGAGGYPGGPAGRPGPGAPPGQGAPGTTIQCPRCRSTLDISRMPRPTTFNCPTCTSTIEIR